MDIEFHYYMTYLVATKAGFGPPEATVLAHSSQYVDDNDIIFEVDKGEASAYRNYISQTMNILKPKGKLFRIYPIFHFIPGDPRAETAWRKDGKMHWLNTTPNSQNANKIFDTALASKNLYRIGIATHGYVDTWAHQNFLGYYDEFSALGGPLAQLSPNIGHADAGHNPDWPALVWKDSRLLNERVDNKARFLDAACFLLDKLIHYTDPAISDAAFKECTDGLRADLDKAIGEKDQSNDRKDERIARYRELSGKAGYGDEEVAEYDEDKWIDDAVNEDVRGLRDKSDFSLTRWDPFTDVYTWKDKAAYRESDWHQFQEGVKTHQNATWEILAASNLKGLELPSL